MDDDADEVRWVPSPRAERLRRVLGDPKAPNTSKPFQSKDLASSENRRPRRWSRGKNPFSVASLSFREPKRTSKDEASPKPNEDCTPTKPKAMSLSRRIMLQRKRSTPSVSALSRLLLSRLDRAVPDTRQHKRCKSDPCRKSVHSVSSSSSSSTVLPNDVIVASPPSVIRSLSTPTLSVNQAVAPLALDPQCAQKHIQPHHPAQQDRLFHATQHTTHAAAQAHHRPLRVQAQQPPTAQPAATAVTAKLPVKSRHALHCVKLLVLEVSVNPIKLLEKILRAVSADDDSQTPVRVLLRGEWYVTPVRAGDRVNVIGLGHDQKLSITKQLVNNMPLIVDNDHLLLILHPDVLVSGTKVGSSFPCLRKAVIQEITQGGSGLSLAAVEGNIAHEMFQVGLATGDFSKERLLAVLNKTIRDNSSQLYGVGSDEEAVRVHLTRIIPLMQAWESALYQGNTTMVKWGANETEIGVCDVLDIEENVWSPTFGLKGKIDASITMDVLSQEPVVRPWNPKQTSNAVAGRAVSKGNLQEGRHGHSRSGGHGARGNDRGDAAPPCNGARRVVAPLELKTGRSLHIAHHAQTVLYTLLMTDRYDDSISGGLLCHIHAGRSRPGGGRAPPGVVQSLVPPALRGEIRALLVRRNLLARFLAGDDGLPEFLQHQPGQCQRCYQLDSCSLYGRTRAGAGGGNMPPSVKAAGAHLTSAQARWLSKWLRLVQAEERQSLLGISDLWKLSANERAKQGKCLPSLTVQGVAVGADQIQEVVLRASPGYDSFLDARFSIGSYVTLSFEGGPEVPEQWAVCAGTVCNISASTVGISIMSGSLLRAGAQFQPKSPPTADTRTAPAIRGHISIGYAPGVPAESVADLSVAARWRGGTWRVDATSITSPFRTQRNNLLSLCASPEQGSKDSLQEGTRVSAGARATWLRGLIVDLRPPRFDYGASSAPNQLGMELDLQGNREHRLLLAGFKRLNPDQQKAVSRAMVGRDYCLVLGMPGTGKSATIAFLVRLLAAQRKRVLLCSYTNAAVDNLLVKLKESKQPFLRLGRSGAVHPDVREGLLEQQLQAQEAECTSANRPFSAVAAIKDIVSRHHVFASTALGCKHTVLQTVDFDCVIVDEAGQITMPACVGPLLRGSRFVLVGDHYQLPPLVTSHEARAGGLGESLFRKLAETHPDAVQHLTYQYRMNEDILLLCNTLVYNHQLRCGSRSVAAARLILPCLPAALQSLHTSPSFRPSPSSSPPSSSPCWMSRALASDARVVFLDTSRLQNSHDSTQQAPGVSTSQKKGVSNLTEAILAWQLCDSLVSAGVDPSAIAVLSPYSQQVQVVQRVLAAAYQPSQVKASQGGALQAAARTANTAQSVEVCTVDRFQGRDKDCIVLSLVRAHDQSQKDPREAKGIGHLLRDWRRINVALTRAKKKFVMIGSFETLSCTAVLGGCIKLAQTKGWTTTLPRQGLRQYAKYHARVLQLQRASDPSSSSPGAVSASRLPGTHTQLPKAKDVPERPAGKAQARPAIQSQSPQRMTPETPAIGSQSQDGKAPDKASEVGTTRSTSIRDMIVEGRTGSTQGTEESTERAITLQGEMDEPNGVSGEPNNHQSKTASEGRTRVSHASQCVREVMASPYSATGRSNEKANRPLETTDQTECPQNPLVESLRGETSVGPHADRQVVSPKIPSVHVHDNQEQNSVRRTNNGSSMPRKRKKLREVNLGVKSSQSRSADALRRTLQQGQELDDIQSFPAFKDEHSPEPPQIAPTSQRARRTTINFQSPKQARPPKKLTQKTLFSFLPPK